MFPPQQHIQQHSAGAAQEVTDGINQHELSCSHNGTEVQHIPQQSIAHRVTEHNTPAGNNTEERNIRKTKERRTDSQRQATRQSGCIVTSFAAWLTGRLNVQ